MFDQPGVTMEAIYLRRNNWQNLGGIFVLAVCGVEIAGAWSSFRAMMGFWSNEEYSHAWFILPLAALIFIQRFRRANPGGSRAPGILGAIISTALILFGWATGSNTAVTYGTILGIIGLVWSSMGTEAMKTLMAPLVYLFFMVPLPMAFYISTSAEMQLLASKLAMVFISLFGVPASLDGNIIVLGSARLEVAEACNGLRYLFPLVSFAFLVSMLLEDRFWKKLLVVISSFPIAILLNAGRIAMVAVLIDRFDIDTTTGSAHAFEGFAIFFLCIVLLFLEVWFLLRIGSPRGRLVLSELLMLDRGVFHRLVTWPTPFASLLAGSILLLGTSLVTSLPARTEVIPLRQPLALFPMDFKGWRGISQTLDPDSLETLGPTDYLLADYTSEAGAGVPLNFYIAYYSSQRVGKLPHSPQLCLPGGGWSIISQSIVNIPLTDGGSIDANRVIIEKRETRQVMYYWFEERGRHIASGSSLKYYALRDALIDNRTDGALVRIVSPIHVNDEAKADLMAAKLVVDASALLPSYIPGKVAQ
jgi:exosortase D (VPLPA-CTERM-specific)